jgi:uncharacterized XkdX family phage protein
MLNLNFWVLALSWKWATVDQVKLAMTYNDCTNEDLEQGLANGYITQEQYSALVPETETDPEQTGA